MGRQGGHPSSRARDPVQHWPRVGGCCATRGLLQGTGCVPTGTGVQPAARVPFAQPEEAGRRGASAGSPGATPVGLREPEPLWSTPTCFTPRPGERHCSAVSQEWLLQQSHMTTPNLPHINKWHACRSGEAQLPGIAEDDTFNSMRRTVPSGLPQVHFKLESASPRPRQGSTPPRLFPQWAPPPRCLHVCCWGQTTPAQARDTRHGAPHSSGARGQGPSRLARRTQGPSLHGIKVPARAADPRGGCLGSPLPARLHSPTGESPPTRFQALSAADWRPP